MILTHGDVKQRTQQRNQQAGKYPCDGGGGVAGLVKEGMEGTDPAKEVYRSGSEGKARGIHSNVLPQESVGRGFLVHAAECSQGYQLLGPFRYAEYL